MKIDLYDVIIFDCDGVILDSNKLKSEAFATALLDEPAELVEKFIKYHKFNGGISRYIKFEHYFKTIKRLNEYSEELQLALKNYAHICSEELNKSEEIPGVRKFLELLKSKNIPCFVSTGGDTKEVTDAFEYKGLRSFFKTIYGNENTKDWHLSEIKSTLSKSSRLLFIGDSKKDFDVASKFNCDFVYISCVSEWVEGARVVKEASQYDYLDFERLLSDIN